MILDLKNGTISGTPNSIKATGKYTVIASNQDGSINFDLRITVIPPKIVKNWGTFTDMVNGTVKLEVNSGTFGGQSYYSNTLYFAKCSYGQVYSQETNSCIGDAVQVQFCNQNNNSCNGNFSGSTVSSGELYNSCNSLNSMSTKLGNRNNWRVPTKNELKLLINCNDPNQLPTDTSGCSNWYLTEGIPTINSFFPVTPYDFFWTASSISDRIDVAWNLNFGQYGGSIGFDAKTTRRYVRCVSQ